MSIELIVEARIPLLSISLFLLVPMVLLGFACRFLKKDEENLFVKARNLGEAI